MRVLYITDYQGAAVLRQRGHRRNRALGAAHKVELFATSLIRGGHDVLILSTGAVSEGTCRRYPAVQTFESACGARVHYLPGLDIPRANMFYARRHLWRFLETCEPVEAVLLYNLEWLYLEAILAFVSKRRLPLIVEYEDNALVPIAGARFQRWYGRRGAKAVQAARRNASGVVAVSEELVAQLALPNSIVVPGAVGDDVFSIPARRQLLEAGPFRLVYAGSLTRTKGVHELVNAVEDTQNVVLDIVGSGPELSAVRSRTGPRVTVHGEITRDELTRVYGSAHAAVNPHLMLDAMVGGIFPFKITEYIAAGLPVISTRLGSMPEAIAPAIVGAVSSLPADLSAAIETARGRYASLAAAVETSRRWIQQEYSTGALTRKLDDVLRHARGTAS